MEEIITLSLKTLDRKQITQLIRAEAQKLGFSYTGFSKAEPLNDDARKLEAWLNKNMHGKMSYMENHFEMRVDPRKLVPGARSVITLMYNYFTEKKQSDESAPKISKYAFGKDYHFVLKEKLKSLLKIIQQNVGEVNGRVFVDSAPVLERAWAKKSGTGWVGKNSNIINKNSGSYFFLTEIILDVEFEYDGSVKDYCGTCTACIDACPTDAIVQSYIVDGSKCISYFTIELKDEILPAEMKGRFENWAFGCDICQEVCPWNRFATQHKESAFDSSEEFLKMNAHEWEEMTEEIFQNLFKHSPLKRTKYKGLKRNIQFLKRN